MRKRSDYLSVETGLTTPYGWDGDLATEDDKPKGGVQEMSNKIKSGLFYLGALLCIIIGITGGVYTYNHESLTYEGKETFATHEEYTEFKYIIGASDVQVQEIGVLSSDPPIVVFFEVDVPQHKEFSYGEGERTEYTFWIFMACPTAFFIVWPIAEYR